MSKRLKAKPRPCISCGSTDHRLPGMNISSYRVDVATNALTCWRCLKASAEVTR